MIELVPAIDVIEGRLVRLTKGDYDTCKIYSENPLDTAKMFEDYGFTRLHMVDLDGAKSHKIVNLPVLETIATQTNLTIDFGGGIKSRKDLVSAFNAGASMVTIGSIAAQQPETTLIWLSEFSADNLILGADALNGKIHANGWKEESDLEVLPFIKSYMQKGFKRVLCTDISKDGMLEGTSLDLYRQIMQECPTCFLTASGGVSSMDDIEKLSEAGIPSVVFGKAIYEGRIDLKELSKKYLQ